jgi:flagellar biosynthesis/type III secretory pathway protein FliH
MTSSEAAGRQVAWQPDPALLQAPQVGPFVPWPLDARLPPTFSVLEVPQVVAVPAPRAEDAVDIVDIFAEASDGQPGTSSLGAADGEPGQDARAATADPAAAPLAQGLAQARQEGWDEGHALGLREGQRRAEVERTRRESTHEAAKAASAERQVALQQQILHALHELRGDARRLHAPLARLALHLAQQLMRAELQSGGQAAARLVEHTLQALGPHPLRVAVRLHPDDLAALGPLAQTFGAHITLEAADHLRRGSVEAVSDGTLVQDLVENRLDALAAQLLGAEPAAPGTGSAAP